MQKPVFSAPIRPGQQLFSRDNATGTIEVVNFRTGTRTHKPGRDLVFEDHNGYVSNTHFAVETKPNHMYRFALNMKNAQRKFAAAV